MGLDLILEIVVGATISLVSFAALRAAEARLTVRRRLRDQPTRAAASRAALFRNDRSTHPVLAWVQSATGLGSSAEGHKLRRDLALAGFPHPGAPAVLVLVRFLTAVGLCGGVFLLNAAAGKPLLGLPLMIAGVLAGGAGFVGPELLVGRLAKGRREQLEHEFPDALDLMVVCMEAGLGLDAAFIRVGEEIRASHPRAAGEFALLSAELRAGRSRADALRSLAERADAEAIRAFTTLLIQTDALGTSIGQTLRSYATELRANRFLAAEQKAMRIPVLMTVPLITCILPVVVTALLLPPLLDVLRVMIPSLTHHRP